MVASAHQTDAAVDHARPRLNITQLHQRLLRFAEQSKLLVSSHAVFTGRTKCNEQMLGLGRKGSVKMACSAEPPGSCSHAVSW